MSLKSNIVKKIVLAVSSLLVFSSAFLTFSIIKSNEFSKSKVIKDDLPQIGDNGDNNNPSDGNQEDNSNGQENPNNPSNGGSQENPNNPSDNQDVSIANENFNNLKKLMSNNNYFDTIIKKCESKSDYLTSSFAWKNSKNKYTSEEQMSKFKELFNIPEIKNINFEIMDVKYSYNDNSLLNTEMKVKVKITNTLTNNYFGKEYKISGFFDPFGGSYIAHKKERADLVSRDYKSLNEIDKNKTESEILKHYQLHPNQLGYGTKQYSWVYSDVGPFDREGFNYRSYFILMKQGLKGEHWYKCFGKNTNVPDIYPYTEHYATWISWCMSRMELVAKAENKLAKSCKTSHVDSWFFDGGKNRWRISGTLGSKGLCVASCMSKFKVDTFAVDKKGNKAENNYKTIERTLFIWFYFLNGWWKAV